jgi:4-hydroxy-4-methyl-2-oxoglutarate aldolase
MTILDGYSFDGLMCAHVADACVRLRLPVRVGPVGIRPVVAGSRVVGRVRPVRHFGSADAFFEAFNAATSEDILVIDNGGRLDEACVGDLVILDARAAALGGVVIWGAHRDTIEIAKIGLPLFSLGAIANGPLRLDDRTPDALISARIGSFQVTGDDVVIADDDGVVFFPAAEVARVHEVAAHVRDIENAQAALIREGKTLRQQLTFDRYLERRRIEPGYSFRDHLRVSGGAIEA